MSSSSLSAVVKGLEQVLDIRQHVEALFDALAGPSTSGHNHTRHALEAVASKIDILAGAWPSQVAPALQQADSLPGADGASGRVAGVELATDVKAEPAAASVASHSYAASLALQQTLTLLERELDTALLAPVASWVHARKRACTGAHPSALESAGNLSLEQAQPTATAPVSAGVELQQIVTRVRAACPGMQVYLTSFTATGAGSLNALPKDAMEVRVHYPRTFTASIALAAPGQPRPVRVAVDAADKLNEGVAWGTSQHHVFKRIAAVATRALAFFSHRAGVTIELTPKEPQSVIPGAGSLGMATGGNAPTPFAQMAASTPFAATPPLPGMDLFGVGDGLNTAVKTETGPGSTAGRPVKASAGTTASSAEGIALEDLLVWLAAYRDVFTRPCCVTGQLLALDPPSSLPVPPVFRPFMLTRAELLEVAAEASAIHAYHTHAAPGELLGWKQDVDMPHPAAAS